MIALDKEIEQIEALLAAGDVRSVTYAALEARLALEKICYDRLRQKHDYIAHADLRRWQPSKVMTQLLEEVDSHATATRVLSISKSPHVEGAPLEKSDFVEIGTEIGFEPAKIAKLWNGLSNVALHVRLPKSSREPIERYGEPGKIAVKVREALSELKRISGTTMTFSGIGREVKFQCECGKENKRRVDLLKHGQAISCANFECEWSWIVHRDGEEVRFERQMALVTCASCSEKDALAWRDVKKLPFGSIASWDCRACKERNYVAWRLAQIPAPPR